MRPGRALDTETERLTSLLDGLAFTAVLRPDVLDAATCGRSCAPIAATSDRPRHACGRPPP
ncbi:hypothetical protein AB0D83_04310 [Streptomyces decoyicus]|uniref:hypothetical protein n=1 Tax=Streptomyces decoyicus TaxID=249567 RepID=UPI00340C37A0